MYPIFTLYAVVCAVRYWGEYEKKMIFERVLVMRRKSTRHAYES